MYSNNNVVTSTTEVMQFSIEMLTGSFLNKGSVCKTTINDDGSMNSYLTATWMLHPKKIQPTAFMILISDNDKNEDPAFKYHWIWQAVDTVNTTNSYPSRPGKYYSVFNIDLTSEVVVTREKLTARIYAINNKGMSKHFDVEFPLLKPE